MYGCSAGPKKVAVYSHITRWPWDEVPLYKIDLFGKLNVVPNSKPLGIKRFASGISISFNLECLIMMQIQYTKNLNPGSDLNWVQHWVCRIGLLIYPLREKRLRAWYRRLNPRLVSCLWFRCHQTFSSTGPLPNSCLFLVRWGCYCCWLLLRFHCPHLRRQ